MLMDLDVVRVNERVNIIDPFYFYAAPTVIGG
jgi:hypothetical protein